VIVTDGCGDYQTIDPGRGPSATQNNYCWVSVAEKPTRGGKLNATLRLTGSSTGDAPAIALTGSGPGKDELSISATPDPSGQPQYGKLSKYRVIVKNVGNDVARDVSVELTSRVQWCART